MSIDKIRRVIKLDAYDYYCKHLSIINSLLPTNLTPKEIDILGCFLYFTQDGDEMFSTTIRNKVKDKLKISAQSISNFILSLINKGVLIKDDNKIMLKSILLPRDDVQQYQIVIINNDVDGNQITRVNK